MVIAKASDDQVLVQLPGEASPRFHDRAPSCSRSGTAD